MFACRLYGGDVTLRVVPIYAVPYSEPERRGKRALSLYRKARARKGLLRFAVYLADFEGEGQVDHGKGGFRYGMLFHILGLRRKRGVQHHLRANLCGDWRGDAVTARPFNLRHSHFPGG